MSAANQKINPLAIARTFLQGVVELMFLAPIWLTISIYYYTPATSIIWLVLLLIGYIVPQHILSKTKRYKNVVTVFLVAGIAISIVLLTHLISLTQIAASGLLLSLILSVYYMYCSMQSFKLNWRNSFTVAAMVLWMVSYVILQLLKMLWLTEIVPYSLLYYLFGMASFIIFLFITNERMLSEHQIVDKSSRAFRMSLNINRVVISVVAVILLLLTLLRGLQKDIEQWIKSIIQQIVAWFSSKEQESEAPMQQPSAPEMESPEQIVADEPSQFWIYLEMVLKIVVTVVVVVALAAILFFIGKKLWTFLQAIISRMMNPFSGKNHQEMSYIDEIEELKPINKPIKKHKKEVKQAPVRNWEALSDEEAIRALYKQLVFEEKKQGYRIDPSSTAAQIISEIGKRRSLQQMNDSSHSDAYKLLTELYDDVRYGEKGVEAKKIKNIFKFFASKK